MLDPFFPINIGRLELPNRFIRSATFEGLATPEGEVTPKLAEMMAALARGGVGLIVTGNAYVRGDGRTRPTQMAVDRDELLPGLARMAASVHAEGGRIALQLAHAGRMASPADGSRPLGISGVALPMPKGEAPACREMTPDDIAPLAGAFARAAVRAREAGFDAVQLHAAHGYFLSQTLSPFFNRRADGLGGGIANRSKVLTAVYKAVRAAVGTDYPVMIKINTRDYLDPELTPEETAWVCRTLQDLGLDMVELSGGTMASPVRLSPVRPGRFDTPEREAWFREDAMVIRPHLAVPVALVGGVRTLATARGLLAAGVCDMISLSRPLIREPGLVARWRAGDERPAACISDNRCYAEARSSRGLHCVHEAEG